MATPSISRERSPVAVLVDPKTEIPLGERDIRLEDYLNDKIQTRSDFANVANLLENVETQKRQLDAQLKEARAKLEASKKASANHNSLILQRAKEFEQQQRDVDKRLMIVANANTPEEAVERLKGPMEKLRKVDLAQKYVELLKEADDLTKDARKNLPSNPKEALVPYTHLKELARDLKKLKDHAEGAGVHLVNYIDQTSVRLWDQMKKIMTDEFEAINKKSSGVPLSREWSDCFERLLDLQYPELIDAKEPIILLPMGVLAKTPTLQFRYHFLSDRSTTAANKLGDHFFAWFVGTVQKEEGFLRDEVGPILAAHFRGNILAGNSICVDPVAAFITALLPVLKEKVDGLLKEISNDPRLLSRFMHQLFEFDETIRTAFNYDAGNIDLGWKGLAWDVLDTYFDRWLQVEKDFALSRYQEIIKSPDSIDYDSTTPGKTKYTVVATQVTDLLFNITKSYNQVRRFRNKMYFLIDIQAEILDQYLGRLSDSLDVYQTITSPLGRRLHGITREKQAEVEGIRGLESLCKVFGSAEHIILSLKEWSNEEFFVDLFAELQRRAQSISIDDNIAGQMSYSDVKEATSNAVGSDDEGSVFDMTIENFTRLQSRALELLIQALKYQFPQNFKLYLTTPLWTTVGDEVTSLSTLAITPELDQPLQALREELGFLQRTLAWAPFRKILRASFDSLQDLLWNEVLQKNSFTALGAARLAQDVKAIENLGTYPHEMPKLSEGVSLLNLPLNIEEGHAGPSLKEACAAISGQDSEADAFLRTIGCVHINRYNARSVLKKRVETFDWGFF